jgi:hypothetical protein
MVGETQGDLMLSKIYVDDSGSLHLPTIHTPPIRQHRHHVQTEFYADRKNAFFGLRWRRWPAAVEILFCPLPFLTIQFYWHWVRC